LLRLLRSLRLSLGCVVVASIVGIAGCGGDSGSSASTSAKTTPQATPQAATTGEREAVDTGSTEQTTTTSETASPAKGYSGPPRPNGIIAQTEASETKVSATATVSKPIPAPQLPSGSYRMLTVHFKTEYRSGIRPIAVRIAAGPPKIFARVGGVTPIDPQEDIQSGVKKTQIAGHAGEPVDIAVEAITGHALSVGKTEFTIPTD
jgi:hypothetical protein